MPEARQTGKTLLTAAKQASLSKIAGGKQTWPKQMRDQVAAARNPSLVAQSLGAIAVGFKCLPVQKVLPVLAVPRELGMAREVSGNYQLKG